MTDVREDFIKQVQADDWSTLADALRNAANGSWSIAASNIAARIVAAARIVGPTPISECVWELVSGGVYAAVLTAGSVPFVVSAAEFSESEKTMAKHCLVGADARKRYANTVDAIRSDRETAWIATGV